MPTTQGHQELLLSWWCTIGINWQIRVSLALGTCIAYVSAAKCELAIEVKERDYDNARNSSAIRIPIYPEQRWAKETREQKEKENKFEISSLWARYDDAWRCQEFRATYFESTRRCQVFYQDYHEKSGPRRFKGSWRWQQSRRRKCIFQLKPGWFRLEWSREWRTAAILQ